MSVSSRGKRIGLDAGVCAALVAATFVYTARWPRDFYWYDEGLLLYEAKRILNGDVIYRDFFEIVTPAVWYLMALLFRLFGTHIETARMAMTVLHAISVALIFLCCRTLRVGRVLAAAAAAAYIGLAFPALPNTSPHWFSTCLSLLLLLLFLRRPPGARARWALLPGVLVGVMVAVQQQKAAFIGASAVLLLLVDHWIDVRQQRPAPPLRAQLLWFTAGAGAVILPLFAFLAAVAGVRPLLAGLIEFPLLQYRGYHRKMSWGYYVPWLPNLYAFPELLRSLPIVWPVAAVRAFWMARRAGAADELKALLAELVFCLGSIGAIYYNPNYTHVAFIAPLFFVLVADTAHWALSAALRRTRWAPFAIAGLSSCVLAGVAWVAWSNLTVRQEQYATWCHTAFGDLDFRETDQCLIVAALRERVPAAPSREMLCYPFCAGLYLMTDTVNPTPYQILLRGYSAPEHFQHTLELLEQRKVPYVVILPTWVRWEKDPVVAYVRAHYHRVFLGGGRSMAVALFERNADPSPASGS